MADDKLHKDQWDQKMNDLPLPDSEASWQNMKQKLDEDDRRRRIIPPFILNCAAWSLLGIALLAGGWFIYNQVTGKEGISKQSPGNTTVTTTSVSTVTDSTGTTHSLTNTVPGEDQQAGVDKSNNKIDVVKDADVFSTDKAIVSNKRADKKNTGLVRKNNDKTTVRVSSEDVKDDKMQPVEDADNNNDVSVKKEAQVDVKTVEPGIERKTTGKDSLEVIEPGALEKAEEEKQDTTTKKEAEEPLPAVAENDKTSKPKKSKYYVSAGAGMHQQIPVGEQKSVSYNYYGKPNTVSDYIPSVYLRLHKQEKWFIETGARYGAPQAVPQFSYSQNTTLDTVNTKVNRTSVFLRKTFYHQLPLSFNYYILPNWSVGGGGIYSIFHGAVAEQEVHSYNYLNQEETMQKSIVRIKEFNDSFLYKTQAHLLLQTEYKWNRLSLGLRYTKGLESYIKYTMPDGTVVDEKNHSLEMMLRFRLWQSKKK